jgi:hypothetical protein
MQLLPYTGNDNMILFVWPFVGISWAQASGVFVSLLLESIFGGGNSFFL